MSLMHYTEAQQYFAQEDMYRELWQHAEGDEEEEVLQVDRESVDTALSASTENKPVIRFMESDTQSEPSVIASKVRAALNLYCDENESAADAEVENYIINCVVQREPRSHKWDSDDLAAFVGELATEKYFDAHIDDFVDDVTSLMYFNVMLLDPPLQKRAENPRLYGKYVLVWKYDEDFHNMYDGQCFIDDYFSRSSTPYDDFWGNMAEQLQKNGLLMNVDKFRHYYKRGQTQKEVSAPDDSSLYLATVGSPISMDYCPSYEIPSADSVPRSVKAVHFELSPRMLHINQQEAPVYVYLDATE